MAIFMKCRHCEKPLGQLEEHPRVYQLLNEELSIGETTHMIKETENGEMMIQLVCETCEETLMQNPGLFENDNFIH